MLPVEFLILFNLLVLTKGLVSEDDTKIIMVHALFRHGERTPEGSYPTDPYINCTYYPVGLGELTNNGKMQEYNLGKWLRSRYDNFLGDVYTDAAMEVRSTGFTRTRKSALLLLAGLWPPRASQIWNSELPWQPIPVDYRDMEDDDLLNVDKCQRRLQLLNGQEDIPEVQEIFIKPFKPLTTYLSENTGLEINNPVQIGYLNLILKTEESWNLALPKWTESVYPDAVYQGSSLSYQYLNYHLENNIINSGYLLSKILNDTKKKMEGTFGENDKKIMLYSGHESTIGVFLDTVGVAAHVPDYSSCIILEVHKIMSSGKYAIKMVYKPDPNSSKYRELTLKGCTLLCPVDTFREILSKYIPTKPYKDACKPIC